MYGSGEAQVIALRGVSVDLERGRYTAIMGPSGSGKSTLMHCLAGLDSVTRGEVYIGDIRVTGLRDDGLTTLRRDKVGFVFQQFNLLPTLTAEENILLPLAIAGRKPDRDWFDTVIDTVGLRDRLSHRPTQLSGGQQQRVACARALVSRPEVIFADEPTGNLDSRSGAEVLGFLRDSVREFGQTIVMVTHDPNAASYADRVVFLADGRIVDELRGADAPRPCWTSSSSSTRAAGQRGRGSALMLRATLKSLLSRKLRLILSDMAVVLGVMFVSGAFVLTDTLGRSFDGLFTDIYEYTDVEVSKPVRPGRACTGQPTPAEHPRGRRWPKVDGVDGVARATGQVFADGARVVGKNGKTVRQHRRPALRGELDRRDRAGQAARGHGRRRPTPRS